MAEGHALGDAIDIGLVHHGGFAEATEALGKAAVVDKTDVYRITQSMPFSHRG